MNQNGWSRSLKYPCQYHHRILGITIILVLSLAVSGCALDGTKFASGFFHTITPSPTNSPVPTSTSTIAPTSTPTATDTPTPTVTSSPTMTPTSTFAYHPAGKVCIPILLYHHVVPMEAPNRYSISAANFAVQMAALKNLGYTTVSVEQLVRAVEIGDTLPQNPLVITFDDGYEDVYQNAYPALKNKGFTATILLVSTYVGTETFMTQAEVLDLIKAGWEVGSHSRTHLDLTKNYPRLQEEIVQSRADLMQLTGQDIRIFAYPYGAVDPTVFKKVVEAGYTMGLGLGNSILHDLNTVYYLDRIEVRSDTELTSLIQAITCPEE